MNVFVHPAARAALNEAIAFYAERGGRELAPSLIAEFERVLDLLSRDPELGAVWRDPVRRLPLRRFSYNRIYQSMPQGIWVIVLAHQRRRPGYRRTRT